MEVKKIGLKGGKGLKIKKLGTPDLAGKMLK